MKLVNQHLETLKTMAEAVTCMVQKVCDHVKMEATMKNEAQIDVFKAWHVKNYTLFHKKIGEKIGNGFDRRWFLFIKRIYLYYIFRNFFTTF